MKKYPDAAAVLVRRHGVYVWGESLIESEIKNYNMGVGLDWEKAKTQAEVCPALLCFGIG
jgi:methylthioribulose-1-phosphate dehydratase